MILLNSDEAVLIPNDKRFILYVPRWVDIVCTPVDEESAIVQSISTHRGTYKMNRLSFGIKTASSEFNRIIEKILRDITTSKFYSVIFYSPILKLRSPKLNKF